MWKVGESLVCGDRVPVRTQRSGRRGVGVALVRSSFSCCFVFVYRALCSVIEPTCKSCVQTTVQYFYLNLLMLIVVGGGSDFRSKPPLALRAPRRACANSARKNSHTRSHDPAHSESQSSVTQLTAHRSQHETEKHPRGTLDTFGICTFAHSPALAAPCLSPPPALGRKDVSLASLFRPRPPSPARRHS